MRRRTVLASLAATLAALAGAPALAASAPAPVLSAEDQAVVSRAVAYLQGLTNAKGRFIQTDARGGVAQGSFFLRRPGKARFEYDPPSGLIMASDGALVAILNTRLKTYEAYPLGMTPLSLFLAKEIRMDKGVAVSRVIRLVDGFTLVATDARKKNSGQIAINFSDTPLALQGWTITDAQGQSTRIRLTDFAPTGPLDAGLFKLKDPRPPVTPHR